MLAIWQTDDKKHTFRLVGGDEGHFQIEMHSVDALGEECWVPHVTVDRQTVFGSLFATHFVLNPRMVH